jgi:hypothetical protein
MSSFQVYKDTDTKPIQAGSKRAREESDDAQPSEATKTSRYLGSVPIAQPQFLPGPETPHIFASRAKENDESPLKKGKLESPTKKPLKDAN